jgi:hypothetical protein
MSTGSTDDGIQSDAPRSTTSVLYVPEPRTPLGRWLAHGGTPEEASHVHEAARPWYAVLWLTGVDYFSTLGYQPGIALLAAGALSPIATAVLVLVTLFGALPIYTQVARRSFSGQGSIAMLERLFAGWKSKLFILVLMGFAATDFVITMTLSAADAAEHVVENPYVKHAIHGGEVWVTLGLLALLAAVFLKGFREAIGVAVAVVAVYLVLNAVVLVVALQHVFTEAGSWAHWRDRLFQTFPSPWRMLTQAVLVFPGLALGLSGFETGVAVMPLVEGDPADTVEHPRGRIRNARKLLIAAASVMSVYLIGSSLVTAVLIPPAEFAEGGEANGRALAYLAHLYLGKAFGTLYDLGTIFILWFAGASAVAGLLNLVPQFLPPYGMAPEWARATRPLVVTFTLISMVVTIIFKADVDAQAGAYATGVLAFMTSAALAVTIANWHNRRRWIFAGMTLIFVYTTAVNIVKRPEGLKIAMLFTMAIMLTSLVSRAWRATELTRIERVELNDRAAAFIEDIQQDNHPVRIVAHRPDKRTVEEYDKKERQARDDHSLDSGEPLVFVEVTQGDASDFSEELLVRGVEVGRHRILRCKSPAVPNALAALLIHVHDRTGKLPHAYFGWTEGNPITYVLKYLALGEGDTAPVTREILRQAIKNPLERPRIHVG